ncbi:BTAD domain-containing putative transcriptional regulator [Microbacterium sp. A93]|uniref:AfsR/SARP family transcriptional regulator n=1 Tax=Microbacterium sp. A93 TaxID=3450716 RepID=UPI003F41C581
MQFRVLGPVSFSSGGVWRRPSGKLRQQLLAVLLTRPGELVGYDALAEALWGEPVANAQQRLHLHIHRLRLELAEPELIVGEQGGYRLQAAPDAVDSLRFERAAHSALALTPGTPGRSAAARAALDTWSEPWGGVAFAGADAPPCRDESALLDALRIDVAEAFFAAEIDEGRHLDVLFDLRRAAQQHPLREQLQGLLMSALHQSGRSQDALEVYRITRDTLVDELGIEPSGALQSIQQAVLTGSDAIASIQSGPTPAQLPPAGPLIGRETELTQLDVLDGMASGTLAVLSGPPGVGKSALAVTWASRHRDAFTDGQLFVDLQGYSETTPLRPDAVLDGFIRALGADPSGLRDIRERTATFRSILAHRSVLVVLDNARSAEQVRPLLPSGPSCLALVTSRDSLSGLTAEFDALRVELGGLGAAESVTLLRKASRDAPGAASESDTAWLDLADRCGRLPLTLRVAGELVREDPTALHTLVSAPTGETLDRLELGEPAGSARTVLSWSYRALPNDAAAIFRALGVQPSATIDLTGIQALTGFDTARARRGVDALVRAHLATLEDGWVHQHDLLAAYARDCAGELENDNREHMLIGLADDLLARSSAARDAWETGTETDEFDDSDAARDWLLHALPLIVDTASHLPVSCDLTVVELSQSLYLVLLRASAHDLLDRLLASALAAADRLGDLSARARAIGAIGIAAHRRGRPQDGIEQLLHARELAERAQDPATRAVIANNLGVLLAVVGRQQEALDLYREARALAVELDDAERIRVADSNIGTTLTELGRFDEAEPILVERYEVDLAQGRRSRLAYSACHLAEWAIESGDVDRAAALANQSIEAAREHANLVIEAYATLVLGRAALVRDDGIRAAAILETALKLARRTRETELIALALAWRARSIVDTDPQGSRRLLDEGLTRAHRDGIVLAEIQLQEAKVFVLTRVGHEPEAAVAGAHAQRLREQYGTA